MNKSKPKNKPATVNAQQIEASDSETSGDEAPNDTSTTMVEHSGAHIFGWSRVYSRPKGNMSSHKDMSKRNSKMSEVKFAGLCEATKHPKIKVNNHMRDAILLESVCQAIIVTKIIIRALVMESTRKLNFFLARHGTSK